MTDKRFKEAEKINRNIKQIKDELNFLKRCDYCCIKLYDDISNHMQVKELNSIPASIIYKFAFEYFTKELIWYSESLSLPFKNSNSIKNSIASTFPPRRSISFATA